MRVFDFLDYQAREQAETDFAICGHERITYEAALTRTHRLANAMLAAGIEQGDRIAILAKNRIEVPVLYYAAFKVGGVPVPLNYRLVTAEWKFICNNAMVKGSDWSAGPEVGRIDQGDHRPAAGKNGELERDHRVLSDKVGGF